jgi:hypothetical protein
VLEDAKASGSKHVEHRKTSIKLAKCYCSFSFLSSLGFTIRGGYSGMGRPSIKQAFPTPVQEADPQVAVAEAEK